MGAGDRWFALILSGAGAGLAYGGWKIGDWAAIAFGVTLLLAGALALVVNANVASKEAEVRRLEKQLQDINAALERSDSIVGQAVDALQQTERKDTK